MLAGIGARRRPRRLSLSAIPGCEFWVDAARTETITYASGANVQQIQDLSGKNRHLTKTGSGNDTIYPVYNNAEKGIQFLSTAFDQMVAGSAGDWNFLHNGAGCTVLMMLKISSDFAATGTLLSTTSEASSGIGTNLFYMNASQNVNITVRNGASQAVFSNGAANSLQKDVTQILSVLMENRPGTLPDVVTRNKGVTDIIAPSASTFSAANSTDKLFISKLANGVAKGKFILKKCAIFSRRLRPDEEQRILRAWARDDAVTLTLSPPKYLAVIAGQSNAKGRGVVADTAYINAGATIANAFIWNNAGNTWPTLVAGTNNDAFDNTKLGIEMSLAKNIVAQKGVPLYLAKYAVDGTSLPQWLPATSNFTNLQDMIQRAVWSIEDSGSPCRPVAFVWYQGEADAMNPTEAAQYATRLQQLIDGVNTIYGVAQIPVFVVQIQQNPPQLATTVVQQAGLVTSLTSPYSAYTTYVETGDIAVNFDTHHITAASFEALGARIAERIRI